MADLTEREILSCLAQYSGSAAADCRALARIPQRGPTYIRMRESLKLAEGCCVQMAYWREDTRWLPIGFMFEEAHKRSQHWLRFHYPRPLFLKLAEMVMGVAIMCRDLETKATGVSGTILPKPLPLHRETRPSQVILPPFG